MKRLNSAREISSFYDCIYDYDEKIDELSILKACLLTTHRCTLKCKLCVERTSCYEERYHPSLESLIEYMDAYFRIVTFTQKFDVSGGEPLTRKELPEILAHLLKYKEQFGRLRVLTNGTIIPSDQVCEAMLKFGKQADVLVDNYGEISINALNAKTKLDEFGIDCVLRPQYKDNLHYSGWVDFGDLTLKHSDEEAIRLYQNCAAKKIGLNIRIYKGMLTPCMVTSQLSDFEVLAPMQHESVDLLDCCISDREKRMKIASFFRAHFLTACKYCNGLCDGNERFIPAEQLE